ncbi:TadE-like protein [Virgibacillus subterraneus]|uniref:TadE-like protein n=2 Tax=Virgibacillus TaxID=84406 RepID=A0A1H0ZM03_9BACI|nr:MULTISPECIES: TadE/TadG family type IV pilus assembly protein [Virgibacillus]SDQ28545.1 TadE-like protein [Virgibacillus salinus]SEP95442.1 TadE-like protein [Virgibacillus subterraneus]
MMKLWKKKFRDENGSATIEFLGILPLALLLLMIIWQFIVGVNGVLIAQSAANEYATVYSVTQNSNEAQQAASEILSSTGNYLQTVSINGSSEGGRDFLASVKVRINLVFLPEELFGNQIPSIPYSTAAHGRVIK